MKNFKQFVAKSEGEELYSRVIAVVVKNRPSAIEAQLLFESKIQTLEEGKTKEWGRGYTYRLDRRPENQGGDQLHIFGPKGKAWAYRYNGARSEPHKYSLPTTNTIKDIVTDVFDIPRGSIKEATILSVTEETLLLEVVFA